jgi:hypothetical protein
VGKALSIRQPWAWAIVEGFKDVENRRRPTKYRGPLFIHAGLKEDHLGWLALDRMGIDFPDEIEHGGIIGVVELLDCVEGHKSPWATADCYHWLLANPRPVPFAPMPGRLGIFNVEVGEPGVLSGRTSGSSTPTQAIETVRSSAAHRSRRRATGGSLAATKGKRPSAAYEHDDEALLRPDVGTQATADVDFWTSKRVKDVEKSHLNYVVLDSAWEQSAAYHLEQHSGVAAFVKNQALGFTIPYLHGGGGREYVPDFIVRLNNGIRLILEPKGFDELEEIKGQAAERWVAAVNADGRYGEWRYAVVKNMNLVGSVIDEHAGLEVPA